MNINNVSVKSIILILFFFLSVSAQEKKYILNTVAFYNVENLFDINDDPNNGWDEARTPEGEDKWTEKKYNIKLNNLAKVLPIIGSDVTNSHPAILGLCEVENKQVLIDLVSTEKMKDLNYGIIHFDSKDWRGIDVALLFDTTKFIPRKAKAYPLEVEYKGKPSFSRDVLVVFGFLEKEPINFIVNHWPSRGGGQPSIAQRFKAGELIRRIIDSILSINPKSKIISMRIDQLENGYKSTIESIIKKENLSKSYDIAMREFELGKLPKYYIKRERPNKEYELWKHEDFLYFPN